VKNSPLVSVIIPCYNYGKYLSESIESAINQTYKNIEITIIDDGSTDNSAKIGKKYAKKYPNVKYVHQPNKGIVATRNRCLKEAEGEYLVMLDADDFLDPNYVEETVKLAEKDGLDIVYTNMKTFDLEDNKTNFSQFNIEELKNRNYIHISSLIRTSKAKKYKFDEKLAGKTHEDWDFFLNMCLTGAAAGLCKGTFLNYRIHGKGRNNRAETDENKFEYITTYLYILRKHNTATKHLSGKLIGEWYIAIYNNLQNHKIALRDTTRRAEAEKNAIINSRSYKLARKISRMYNLANTVKRPSGKEVNKEANAKKD
jgi:glycosyltransferase involved in cell wall biosynthesis